MPQIAKPAPGPSFSILVLAICLLVPVCGLPAQISVKVEAPKLKPGMIQLENLVGDQVGTVAGLIEDVVNKTLNKPLFMQGMADAAVQAISLPGFAPLSGDPTVTFDAGCFASFQTDNWDTGALGKRLGSLQPSDDIALGAGLQPLVFHLTVSLGSLVPGLAIRGGFGYMAIDYDAYHLESWYGQLAVDYRLFAPKNNRDALRWEGLLIDLGASYGSDSLSTKLPMAPIVRNFDLDPDGSGPVLPLDVSVRVKPDFALGFNSRAFCVPLNVSTAVTLFDTIGLQVGGGVVFASGKTGLSLKGVQNIEVQGYLADLQARPGTISLSGESAGAETRVIYGEVFGSLRFSVGPLSLSVPVMYCFTGGLSAGLVVGLAF